MPLHAGAGEVTRQLGPESQRAGQHEGRSGALHPGRRYVGVERASGAFAPAVGGTLSESKWLKRDMIPGSWPNLNQVVLGGIRSLAGCSGPHKERQKV